MEPSALHIKIRPRNHPQFELLLAASSRVAEVKTLIAERLGVPVEQQRLIYQGKVLSSAETLEACRVGDNHVIQLICSEAREEVPRVSRPPSPRLDFAHSFFLTRRRRHIFPHREIDPNERFEVLRQSIQTLEGLVQTVSSVPSQPLQPFDRRQRQFHRGQWVDVKDTVDQWLEAQVIDLQNAGNLVKVHYNGWPSRWDEWIEASSPRIQPIRTNTAQTLNSPMHSAHLVVPADAEGMQPPSHYEFSEFVFQACGLLDRVKTMLDRFYVLKRIAAQERELDRRELTQESLQLIQLKPIEDKKTDDLRSDISNFAISSVQEPLSDEEEGESAMTTDQEALLTAAQLATIADRVGRLLSDIGVILSSAGVARRLDDTQSISSSLLTNESGTSQVPTLPMQIPAMATPSELAAVSGPILDLRFRTISRHSAPSSTGESPGESICY